MIQKVDKILSDRFCVSACKQLQTSLCDKQLKGAWTECRSSKGECDLAEYCSGTDPLCPSDVYRRNNDSCTVNGVGNLLTFSEVGICLTLSVYKDEMPTTLR